MQAPSTAARPTVLVYHSHGTEKYGPGDTHAAQGRPGDIVEVGEAFSESLEARGITAIHHTQVYDHPRWAEAFQRAGQAVGSLLQQNDGVQAVIDIHRDAIARDVGREVTTANIGGRPVARILLVVGEQNNPYARENTAFAEALKAKMDALYPGLSRGIRIQPSDYNGRLHPNSVQVFIGDHRYNTVEEAREAARLFAHVVAEVLRERGGV
ncbi:MAG TPA: stage II sporulation protein P [Limnochordales bacterium]